MNEALCGQQQQTASILVLMSSSCGRKHAVLLFLFDHLNSTQFETDLLVASE
jgi:hypothetical protein